MAFIFGYSNLVAKNNNDYPNYQVDMTADWIVVDDGSGNTLRIPMTTTVKIDKSDTTQTSTMANGRDQAALNDTNKWGVYQLEIAATIFDGPAMTNNGHCEC